jgi:hypothetical protein
MEVADRHCRRAPNARGAVEIYRAARRDQAGQRADAFRELFPKFDLFLVYGESQEINAARPIVGFER